MNQKGFTLIELVLVISVMAILAVTAMPKIYSITVAANESASDGFMAGVLVGIALYGAQEMAITGIESYPATLDDLPAGTDCSKQNLCFTTVAVEGVSKYWQKINDATYLYKPTNTIYHYNIVTGEFKAVGTMPE